ncbi:MAG: hypothetical protein ACE5LH_06025 [Fidelibacterota bacterium]
MRLSAVLAVAGVMAVSQIAGQSDRTVQEIFPWGHGKPAADDSTRKHVLTLVSVSSATTALAAAIVAYRYMSRADAAYQRYLHAGDPDEMNRLFGRAQSFDRKAGISLAVFEVSFAIAVYTAFCSLTL